MNYRMLLVALFGLLAFALNTAQAVEKPNVVLIFIDNMGYGDVGFNGATGPKTPHLDQMARKGIRLRKWIGRSNKFCKHCERLA